MRNTKKLFAAITLSTVSKLASAEVYLGGNYAFIGEDDIDVGALVFKAGYQFNEWAALEARAGFGVDDDSYLGVDVELESLLGGYFVAGLPNDTMFYPYVAVGYTRAEVEASGFGVSVSDDESDLSFGVGTDIGISENVAGNVEFMRYLDKDGGELDAISLGFTYRF